MPFSSPIFGPEPMSWRTMSGHRAGGGQEELGLATYADSTLSWAVRDPSTPLPLLNTSSPQYLRLEVKRPPCLMPSRTIPLGEDAHSLTPLSE